MNNIINNLKELPNQGQRNFRSRIRERRRDREEQIRERLRRERGRAEVPVERIQEIERREMSLLSKDLLQFQKL